MNAKTAFASIAAAAGLVAADQLQAAAQCQNPPPTPAGRVDKRGRYKLGTRTLMEMSHPVIVAKYGVPILHAIQRGDLVEMIALRDEVTLALGVLTTTPKGQAYAASVGLSPAKIAEVQAALSDLNAAITAACP